MPPVFALSPESAVDLHVIDQDGCAGWLETQAPHVARWAAANGFTGAIGQSLLVPAADGSGVDMALAGYGTAAQRARRRFVLAAAAATLPEGTYSIASGLPGPALDMECFGWLMTGYAFSRYAAASAGKAALAAPAGWMPALSRRWWRANA